MCHQSASKLQIFKNPSELEGTGYFELSPGIYEGKHWQDGCLFFEPEVFGYIEPLFEKYAQNYDHFDMNDIGGGEWLNILAELKRLATCLRESKAFEDVLGQIGFPYAGMRDDFQVNFFEKKEQLANLIDELVSWAEKTLTEYGCIALLGL